MIALAVVQAVVQAAPPPVAPVAAPVVVVHPVVHVVAQTVVHWWQVDHFKGIATQLLIFLTGVSASLVHWLFSRDRLSRPQNIVLLHAYSIILGVLEVIAKGQWSLGNLGAAYMGTVGAATAMYAILYAAVSAKQPASPTDSTLPVTSTLQ